MRKLHVFILLVATLMLLLEGSGFTDSLKIRGRKLMEGEVVSADSTHIGFKTHGIYSYFPWDKVQWVMSLDGNMERKIREFAPGKFKSPSMQQLRRKKSKEKLTSSNWQERKEGVLQLSRFKDPALFTRFSQMLDEEENEEVKAAIIKALGEIGNRSATPILIEYLKDPDPQLRKAAIISLQKLKDPRSLPVLRERLTKDANDKVRAIIAQTLGSMKDEASISLLLSFLRNYKGGSATESQIWALRALGQIQPENTDVVFTLSKILMGQYGGWRFKRECVDVIGKAAKKGSNLAVDALLEAGKKYLPKSLERGYWIPLLRAIIFRLGESGDRRTTSFLLRALSLKVGYGKVSQEAAEALIKINDPSITPHLIENLKEAKNRYVRKSIIQVLGAMGDKRAGNILRKIAIEDPNSQIREAAREALSQMQD